MFRSKIKLAVLTLGILGFLAFGLFIDYHAPQNPVSVALFKAVYTLTPFKYSFLEYYSPLRRDVYNGDILPEVDTFLCERLEVSDDPAEIEAIVHLYGMQTGGREGGLIQERTEKTQEKIAAEIMRQLEKGGTHLTKRSFFSTRYASGKGRQRVAWAGKVSLKTRGSKLPENGLNGATRIKPRSPCLILKPGGIPA
jgi:hypothetical protein